MKKRKGLGLDGSVSRREATRGDDEGEGRGYGIGVGNGIRTSNDGRVARFRGVPTLQPCLQHVFLFILQTYTVHAMSCSGSCMHRRDPSSLRSVHTHGPSSLFGT